MRDARRCWGRYVLGWLLVACAVLGSAAAQALIQDLTSQFAITRSGLVLNRTKDELRMAPAYDQKAETKM